jgi:hypothetical protein
MRRLAFCVQILSRRKAANSVYVVPGSARLCCWLAIAWKSFFYCKIVAFSSNSDPSSKAIVRKTLTLVTGLVCMAVAGRAIYAKQKPIEAECC